MFRFKKKKAYIITWTRPAYRGNETRRTVVIDKCESYAVLKFLRCHNVKLEKIEILNVNECVAIQ